MALFQDEEMVDVTTPDGRTLTLPRSIVPPSLLPQPQIAAPAPAATPASAPGAPSEEAPAPTLPPPGTSPSGGVVEPGEPDVYPVGSLSVVEPGEPSVKTEKQLRQEAKQAAAYAASPTGRIAGAQAQQDRAAQAEAGAVIAQADVDAATQDVVAGAYTERNAKIDKLMTDRAQEAQANADAEERKMGEIVALRKKIAGTKIDRTTDHPIIAALAVALAGFGSALKGESENPALTALNNAIDRKVAAQEADLDRMGKVYGMTKDELAMLKEKSKSRLEFHNALIAGETEKAIRHIEELTARSASDKTKANAKMLIAQLQARAADKSVEAMRWGLDYNQKVQAERNQNSRFYSDLKFRRDQQAENTQVRREEIAADLEKALAATRASGDAAAYKARLEQIGKVRETGLKNLTTGEYLLTPEGKAKMAQAAQLEAEAQKLEEAGGVRDAVLNATGAGKQRAALLRQKASILRGDAQTYDAIQGRNAEQAGKISDQYAAAQSMMDTIDEIKMLYDQAGRGYIGKDQLQQELQTKFNLLSVKGKEAWQLGAWDKGSATLTANIVGRDPTDGWDVGALAHGLGVAAGNDPEGFKKRLDAVAQSLEQDVRLRVTAGSNWNGKGELFTRKNPADLNTPIDKASADITEARSGVELEKNAADVGTVGKIARKVGYPFSPSHADEAENAQSLRYPGMSRGQEAGLDTLARAAKSTDPKTRQQAIDELAAKAVNEVKRPDFAVPFMQNLQQISPEAYSKARAAIPDDTETGQRLKNFETMRVGVAMQPTELLRETVLSSINTGGQVQDADGYRELARRASQGDALARKAILDAVAASGRNKNTKGLR